MCPRCLATIRTYSDILHHSRLNPMTFPGLSADHYDDVIMSVIASQITSLAFVYSTVYSEAYQRKHQSSASLAFVRGPVNSPRKWPVTRKMFLFDDVIMNTQTFVVLSEESVNRTVFRRLMPIVRRNRSIHFGNAFWSCPCSSGRQACEGNSPVTGEFITLWCVFHIISHSIETWKVSTSPNRTESRGLEYQNKNSSYE